MSYLKRLQPPRCKVVNALLAVLVGMSLPLSAAAIDLSQSYELALQNDRQLQAAKAKAAGDSEVMPQAIGQMLPNLSFSASRSSIEQVTTYGSRTYPKQSYPSEGKTLTLKQPLIRPYLLFQYGQAKSELQRVDADLSLEQQNLAVRVTSAYLEAIFARERQELIDAQKASYYAQVKSATAAFRAGSGTRTDIDDAQAKYDRLLAQEIQAKQTIDATTNQLEVYVGQPVEALSVLQVGRLRLDDFDPGELDTWMQRAVENSPELRSWTASVEAAKSGINMARSGHSPTLDLVAQYSDSNSESIYNVGSQSTTKSIGLQLYVPLYAGGQVNSGIRQAQAQVDERTERYEYTYRDVQLRVRKAYNSTREGIATVHALEQAMHSAEQMVVSNRRGVKAGTRTSLNVLDAEQQRLQTQIDLAQARYQTLQGWVQLMSLVNGMNSEEVGRINSLIF